MALIGVYGFEGRDLDFDQVDVSGGAPTYSSTVPAGGSTRSLREPTASSNVGLPLDVATSSCSMTLQVFMASGTTANDNHRIGWRDGVNLLGYVDWEDNTRRMRIWIDGALVATSVDTIPVSQWTRYHLEVILDGTVGRVSVYVDGDFVNPFVEFTGNTDPTAALSLDTVHFAMGSGGFPQWLFDNLVVIDATAGGPTSINDIISVSVKPKAPDGDGAASDWTATGSPGGASDFNYVDEVPPDDGDYVRATAAAQTSTYTFENESTDTVIGVRVKARVLRGDASAGVNMRFVARQGGVNYVKGIQPAPTEGPVDDLWSTAPDGTAWDNTKFNGVEFGVRSVT